MLGQIHKEHKNIIRLLNVLESKLTLIRAEQSVRYKLIHDIIDYMQEYADKYHHPKEDHIYDYYLKYCDVSSEIENRLHQDHSRLKEETADLQAIVDMILMDAVVPLDQFAIKLEDYINSQRDHLNFEEGELLPQIVKALSEDDWKQIELKWKQTDSEDPLFGLNVAKKYQDLAKRINQVI